MRRILRLIMLSVLAVIVAIVSFIIVDLAGAPGVSPTLLINGLMAGAMGLILGLGIAWMRGVPWRLFPVLMRVSYRRLQHEFWWLAAGTSSLAVLVLY
jgi:hypothetical protein